MKRYVYTLIGLLVLGSLSGCGTIRGIGEDLSAMGRGVMGVSDHVRENITGDKEKFNP